MVIISPRTMIPIFRLIFSVPLVGLSAAAPSMAQTIESRDRVEGWEIERLQDQGIRACEMKADLQDGSSISFRRWASKPDRVAVLVSNESWASLNVGERYTVSVNPILPRLPPRSVAGCAACFPRR